jgi:hypothetical protein
MKLAEIENILRVKLPTQTVSQLEGFPCTNYSDFLDARANGRVEVLTRFDIEANEALATGAELLISTILSCAPYVVAAGLLLAAFVLWNFWLLLGIPLALLGMFFSVRFFMRGFGRHLRFLVSIYFVYSSIKGHGTAAFLSGAYAISNYLTCATRRLCDVVVRRSIEKFELVLIWLVLNQVVIVRAKG